jgi:hypothetical protein
MTTPAFRSFLRLPLGRMLTSCFRGVPMASTLPHAPARYVDITCLTGRHEQCVVEALAETVVILACFRCDVEWTVPSTDPALRALTV